MSDPFAHHPLPRGPLIGAGALVAVALFTVMLVRIMDVDTKQDAAVAVVFARDLLFEDRPDGGIAVYDARDRHTVDMLEPGGGNGFIRGALRSLVRDRRRQGIGPELPFRLAEGADGSLLLQDLATGREIALDAFGATNKNAFARFLTAQGDTR